MGAAFTETLRARGDEVVVWNRTPEKALALERFGARAEPGAIVIDHSTVAAKATAARFERLAARGQAFLHAPLFMSPSAVRAAQGVMLVCGPRAAFESVAQELEAMAGRVHYLGEDGSKAAALKLAGNAMGTLIAAGLADTFSVGRSAGVTPRDALELLIDLQLQGLIERLGAKMISGDITPNVELRTARKDVRLMLEAAGTAGENLYVLPAIAARMDALIAGGHGSDDVVVLGADERSPYRAD